MKANAVKYEAEIKRELKATIDQLKQQLQSVQSLQVDSYQLELGQVAFAVEGLVCRHVLQKVFTRVGHVRFQKKKYYWYTEGCRDLQAIYILKKVNLAHPSSVSLTQVKSRITPDNLPSLQDWEYDVVKN